MQTVMHDGRKPHILLCSAWQNINIGDVAHTPSCLALLAEFIPDADVTVWAYTPLAPDGLNAIQRQFPKVAIVSGSISPEGKASNPELDAAIRRADFLLHGSGPAMLAWNHAEGFQRLTGRPFGVYGVTYGLYGIPERETLSRTRFTYFRDSVSLATAKKDKVHAPITEFAPDVAFAFNDRDDRKASAYLAANGLERGNFLCCIARMRYTPFWLVADHAAPFDPVRHARNEEMKFSDSQPLVEAITRVVRETPMKVLICPEDITQMAISKQCVYDRLPADVKERVVWRNTFWLPNEALSVYAQSAGLFGCEMHSPIMCIGNGIPAIVCRWAEQSTKGFMWRDIGLNDWLFDLDNAEEAKRVASTVLALAQNPVAAKEKAEQARQFVRNRYKETFAVVEREVRQSARSRKSLQT